MAWVMSPSLEGRIDICLPRSADGVARIVSSRPQVAQRLLAGRSPGEAAELAGMIFTLCGKAQRSAAEAACAAAQGRAASAADSRSSQPAILAEMVQEHAWRLLLDWPARQGQPADPGRLLHLRRAGAEPAALAEALDDLLAGTLLGEPAADWLGRFTGAAPLAGFDAWAHGQASPTAALFAALGQAADQGISRVPLLPALVQLKPAEVAALAEAALADPGFCARPEWPVTGPARQAAETGALARCQSDAPLSDWLAQRGRGVGARMLARLLELARLPAWLRGNGPPVLHAWSLPDQVGVAGVETSRGLLLHLVRLAEGKVDQYRIIAPTEWNFHPAGALAEALAGLTASADPEAAARRIALSLDPCVEYGISLETT